MIQGLVSEGAIGRIFTDWKPITQKEYDELPYEKYYGLDFGFSNDPLALIEIKDHNDNIYLNELIYEVGLTNVGIKGNSLSERMTALGINKNDIIYADSAEPKSIRELRDDGWNVKPSLKGSDSIRSGIKLLSSKNVYFTENSKNIENETYEYKWQLDQNKLPTNKPIDKYNHACDAIRYGYTTHQRRDRIQLV